MTTKTTKPSKIQGTASLYRDTYGATFVHNPQRGFVRVSPTTSRATRFELVQRLARKYGRATFVFEGCVRVTH